MVKKYISRILVSLLTVCIVLQMAMVIGAKTVLAAPTATITNSNPWGSGGQVTMSLSGCEGCSSVTVVVDFGGAVTSASGWGFDTYVASGSKVTATVSSTGANSWGMSGEVGIQVEGTNINSISLVSITGKGATGSDSQGSTKPTSVPTKVPTKVPTATTTTAPTSAPVATKVPVATPTTKVVAAGDDWLTTDGSKIVDKNGTEVWLTGVNWFGYNTGTNIFDGCWSVSMNEALKAIADHGFNLLRVPISSELLLDWKSGVYPEANYNTSSNSDLIGKNSLQIFDYMLELCQKYGIKVMIDIHCVETDAMGHNMPLWYTDSFSTKKYLESLDWVSARYKNNDTVIAYDLKNEPHGAGNEQQRAIWNNSTADNNWRYVATLAGNTVLDNNPNALIVIEGNQIFPKDPSGNNFTSMNAGDYYNAWWGGNLMGVKYYPVDFGSAARNRQIVYSPHDYGPAVSDQPWFGAGFTKNSLLQDYWYDYWFYIKDQNIAPILIGEWGGFMEGDNLTWMTYLRELIGENHLNYTFWCFNANSGDTGGLVLDDFKTWDTTKYNFVKEVIWTDSNGKFVGLDHEVALGSNGVNLNEFSGGGMKEEDKPLVEGDAAGVGGFIERLYSVALERDFDAAGKAYWVDEVKLNGKTGADIADFFLNSPEFLGKKMSEDSFLTILYRTFFDREPDAAGLDYWKNEMKNGKSKSYVIAGFINSEEWANICLKYGILSGSSHAATIRIIPNEKVVGFATRLYTTCLDRDFDAEGLNYWAMELANLKRSGSDVAKGFFFSDEFIGFKTTDEVYITRLYRTLMGREPETDGLTYWKKQMNGGMSREDVFAGFASSKEWAEICSDYGILR